jgi:WASH complex subunit strumpellin
LQGGKQLMAEAVYLYGVILLLLDSRIDGEVRERMLVSHLRYRGHMEYPLIDEVMNLCRATGWTPAKRPPNYPEEYFGRWKVSPAVVRMLIGRLRSDDLYNQLACYPLPEHRSTALAPQVRALSLSLCLSRSLALSLSLCLSLSLACLSLSLSCSLPLPLSLSHALTLIIRLACYM